MTLDAYPSGLEQPVDLPDGRRFVVRPVHPDDTEAFQEMFGHLTEEDIRMRFFAAKRTLSTPVAEKMTHIDYASEMTFVLADPGPAGAARIYGEVHIGAEPDGASVRYDILLRSDLPGLGFGPMLMRRIIDYSRAHGFKEIVGEVLRANRPMLCLCELFGFRCRPDPDDQMVMLVRLPLHAD